MTLNISPHIFRAYDIRGLYNEDLSPQIMYKIGAAFGTYVKKILEGEEVVVGNDVRNSSIPLAYSLIAGILSAGISVTFAGTSAFGQTLYAGWDLKTDAIAYITGSHLPPEWNGIKFYHSEGVGYSEEELQQIRNYAINDDCINVNWKDLGDVKGIDSKIKYREFFSKKFTFTKNIKVALDCGGGSTTLSAPEIFKDLGLDVVPIYCETDPTFSGRPSDPKPKNLGELVNAVKEQSCNFGVAFDGDGDRAVIVDNTGKVLSADETGILIGKYGLSQKTGTIIVNVECSKAIGEQLEPLGYKIKQIPVGHTFLTIEAKQENSPLGIESSGHIIITEYFLFDDALVTPLKIAEILNREENTLSNLVEGIPTYPLHKEEIECSDRTKFDVVEALKTELSENYENLSTLDGVRINLEKGWVLIRPSNTSPIIRMTIEADDEDAILQMKSEFTNRVSKILEKMKG